MEFGLHEGAYTDLRLVLTGDHDEYRLKKTMADLATLSGRVRRLDIVLCASVLDAFREILAQFPAKTITVQ